MILCNASSEVFLCHFCFAHIFRSFPPLNDNVQFLKFILMSLHSSVTLWKGFFFFNEVSFFFLVFNVLPTQNGVFRISPFSSSTAQGGMTCRKAALYIVWSLLTRTTNQSFKGSVFTLSGDWQGSSLQISLLPRTGLISRAEEGSSRDRGLAHKSPTLLSGKSAGWIALRVVFAWWVWVGFFPPIWPEVLL